MATVHKERIHESLRRRFENNGRGIFEAHSSEESWTEENRRALDQFIVDTSVTCVVVYKDTIALSTYRERRIKDNYTKSMHCYLLDLTAVLIHWTEQIKELLNAQDMTKVGDNCGPLQEIAFWKIRSEKLFNISQQLQNPAVRHIYNILEFCKSLYVPRFCKLSAQIQECSLQAQSNLSFLSILREPCEEFSKLKPSQTAPKMLHIIRLIRFIWVNSKFYNTSERIGSLFRKFARWEDGQQRALPIIRGCQEPEFIRSLLEIEGNLHRGLQNLRTVGDGMLDGIKGTIEERADKVCLILDREIKLVNKELNKIESSVPNLMPKIAGQTHCIMIFKQRLSSCMEVLQKLHFIPKSDTREHVLSKYTQMVQIMDEFVRKNFSEWNQSLDGQYIKRLEQPLMVRCKDSSSKLDINFDKNLFNLFSEIHYWDRMKFEIPQIVTDVQQSREDFRVLRERVLLVVRNYNRNLEFANDQTAHQQSHLQILQSTHCKMLI
ncbi:hypothetical protein INR49_027928 [Caranx melampygus]|nr:hypothetical protein INR49_027928 [Caranx melampygus]